MIFYLLALNILIYTIMPLVLILNILIYTIMPLVLILYILNYTIMPLVLTLNFLTFRKLKFSNPTKQETIAIGWVNVV